HRGRVPLARAQPRVVERLLLGAGAARVVQAAAREAADLHPLVRGPRVVTEPAGLPGPTIRVADGASAHVLCLLAMGSLRAGTSTRGELSGGRACSGPA